MNNMRLLSLAVAASLTSTVAFAHSDIDTDCDINLDGEVQYYKGLLTVEMDDGAVMTIDADHNLTINGEPVSLNSSQQRSVDNYYSHINDAIPMTLEIATEGLHIASVAVTEVFSELLGNDDGLVEDFQAMFDDVNRDMRTHFYDEDGNVRIDSRQYGDDGWFDSYWEEQFEDRMESLVAESMGRILVSVGTQMMWGDGDMDDFEERMENFGDNIERRVEKQADALEVKADALCEVLAKADKAESEMQRSIAGLSELNMLDIDRKSMKM